MSVYRSKNNGVWAGYVKRDFLPLKVFIDYLQQQLAITGEQPYSTWTES